MFSFYSIGRTLGRIQQTLERIMSAIDDLRAQVAAETSVNASAVTLIQGLVTKLENVAPDDTAAIQQITADLKAGMQPLADAVAANTIAAPKDAGGGVQAAGAVVDAGQAAGAATGTAAAGQASPNNAQQ